jgi:hypothetical protein
MDLFYEQIVSKPERYENFYMFTMRDEYESKDVLVRGVYTRSLVYFVSGVLEDEVPKPLAGLERWMRADVLDRSGRLARIREFLNQGQGDRLILSKTEATALQGFQCDAISHGDFDNNPATLGSLRLIIGH